MPKPTITVRELKNADSGLDLSIAGQDETPGLLGATVNYHVVAVTGLACYKAPSHKPADVVQFMVSRQLADFEKLHKGITAAFPGTVLPQLPKRGVLGGGNHKERRQALQDFISAIASLPKMSTCQPLVEFLGVSVLKAGVVRTDEVQNKSTDIFEEFRETDKSPKKSKGLFDEPEDDEDDLFAPKNPSHPLAMDDDDVLFTSPRTKPSKATTDSTNLFTSENHNFTDEELFLLPPGGEPAPQADFEDHSDLLNIEDDLSDILNLSNKKPSAENKRPKPLSDSKPATKPKPSIKPKPETKPKPPIGQKPAISPKPAAKPLTVTPKTEDSDDLFALGTDTSDVGNIDTDNIMKYIQDNTQKESDHLDLFT